MRKYKTFATERFQHDLKLLARAGKARLEEKLERYVYFQLKEEPHFGLNIKRLKGWMPPTWRYKIGEWRFFYIVDEELKVVYMIAASHRKTAYR